MRTRATGRTRRRRDGRQGPRQTGRGISGGCGGPAKGGNLARAQRATTTPPTTEGRSCKRSASELGLPRPQASKSAKAGLTPIREENDPSLIKARGARGTMSSSCIGEDDPVFSQSRFLRPPETAPGPFFFFSEPSQAPFFQASKRLFRGSLFFGRRGSRGNFRFQRRVDPPSGGAFSLKSGSQPLKESISIDKGSRKSPILYSLGLPVKIKGHGKGFQGAPRRCQSLRFCFMLEQTYQVEFRWIL